MSSSKLGRTLSVDLAKDLVVSPVSKGFKINLGRVASAEVVQAIFLKSLRNSLEEQMVALEAFSAAVEKLLQKGKTYF